MWVRVRTASVLTHTHNLCFEQKYEECQNFFSESEIFHFFVVKFSTYLNRRVFVMHSSWAFGCPVWSESSLSAWRKHGTLATHWTHSKDSDQTVRNHRLFSVFANCTVDFVMRRFNLVRSIVYLVYHLSIRRNKPEQTIKTRIRNHRKGDLIRVYTLCYLCLFF